MKNEYDFWNDVFGPWATYSLVLEKEITRQEWLDIIKIDNVWQPVEIRQYNKMAVYYPAWSGYNLKNCSINIEGTTMPIYRAVAAIKAGSIEQIKGLHVHHLDHDPFNNHPDNLSVIPHSMHWLIHGFRIEGMIPDFIWEKHNEIKEYIDANGSSF